MVVQRPEVGIHTATDESLNDLLIEVVGRPKTMLFDVEGVQEGSKPIKMITSNLW